MASLTELSQAKNGVGGGAPERYLCGEEYVLFIQRTRVRFAAPTKSGYNDLRHQLQGNLGPLASSGTCPHLHMAHRDTHIHIITNNANKALKYESGCSPLEP